MRFTERLRRLFGSNEHRARYNASTMFGGASTSRLFQDWSPWTFSPDYEVRFNHRFLRARARQLVRDNPYAAGFVRSVSDNLIGGEGIVLQAKITKADGKTLVASTNKEIERAWAEWSMPENASADGRDSWVDFQRLYAETKATDGEVIVRRLRGFDNPFGYTLQFIDADLLDELYNVAPSAQQNEIRMGVEIDQYNRPIAYHIWNRYPTEASGIERKRERIPAEQIIHDFVRYRPNQTRGVTWFAPVLTSLHHLDGYEFAELQAARVAAAKMGWIVTKTPEAMAAYEAPKPTENPRTMDVEPGLISELPLGAEFQSFDPTHPNTNFDQFTSTVLRAISRGLNISQLTLSGDLRQANYSSMRAGLLPERDMWKALQKATAMHFHRVVYRDWISMAILAGAVEVDSRLASNYYEVQFEGRGWSWVDPLKDLQALKLGIDLGVDNRTLANAEQGRDYEKVVDSLSQEEKYAEANDVDVSGNQIAGIKATSVSPEGQEEDAAQPKEDVKAAMAAAVAQAIAPFAEALSQTRAVLAGLERVVEQQATALSHAARTPAPPVVIEQGAIAVTVSPPAVTVHNEAPTKASEKTMCVERGPDGRPTYRITETPLPATR